MTKNKTGKAMWRTERPAEKSIAGRSLCSPVVLKVFDIAALRITICAASCSLFSLALAVVLIFAAPRPAHAVLGDVISSFSTPNNPLSFPRGMTWDGTNLWYADNFTDTIYKLDPSTGGVITSFASPNVNPAGLAWDGTNLWNVDLWTRSFYTIDPGTGASNLEFTKGSDDYFGLTWDGTYLWGGETSGGTIDKLDLAGNVISSYPTPGGASTDLAWDGTNLWITNQSGNIIYKVDPTSGTTLGSFVGNGFDIDGLAFDGDSLWFSDYSSGGTIYEVDDGAAPVSPPTPGPIPATIFFVSAFAMYVKVKFGKIS